ncbi:MAG: hypothetical protein D6763_11200 [Alphaproteobacteria bacterium]|nr:MAG: hypothetical protein D6763_11200 [Alphaproteobacteria bacterium]
MSEVARILSALWGAWRLANFDRSGFDRFEITAAGFWHSFLAAAVGAPLFALHVLLEREAAEMMVAAAGKTAVFGSFYLAAAMGYVLMWLVFAVLMIPLTRIAGVAEGYAGLVIAFNWSRVIALVIRLPVMMIAVWGGLGATAFGAVLLLAYGLILAYQWFVARVALGSGLVAAAVVLVDLVASAAIARVVTVVLGEPILVTTQ